MDLSSEQTVAMQRLIKGILPKIPASLSVAEKEAVADLVLDTFILAYDAGVEQEANRLQVIKNKMKAAIAKFREEVLSQHGKS